MPPEIKTKLINLNLPPNKVDPDSYKDPYIGDSDINSLPGMSKMFNLHNREAKPIPSWVAEGIQLHPEYRAELIRYLLMQGLSRNK